MVIWRRTAGSSGEVLIQNSYVKIIYMYTELGVHKWVKILCTRQLENNY